MKQSNIMEKVWDNFIGSLVKTTSDKKETEATTNPDSIKTIEDVQEFLGDIRSINSGGCGIAAYSIYLWLKKQDAVPEDFNITYLHRVFDEPEFTSNKDFLEGNGKKVDACSHAVVKMHGKYIDSKGDYLDVDDYPFVLGIGTEHIDRFMVNSLNASKWNSIFRRENNIPLIEKTLGIDLSTINRYQ